MKPTTICLTLLVIFYNTCGSPINDSHKISRRSAPSADPLRKWPDGIVYYKMDQELSEELRSEFRRAMDYIQNQTCIQYVERNNETDFVHIKRNETGCLEPVGRQGGEQFIMIKEADCSVYGFYLHAAMQMLGFYHEHSRNDRDDWVSVYEQNISPEWLWAFEKLPENQTFLNTTYDPDSIMHYGSYQFSRNGEPTILKNDGSLLTAWTDKTELTALDFAGINEFYNCLNDN